jgi:hypothetical protein
MDWMWLSLGIVLGSLITSVLIWAQHGTRARELEPSYFARGGERDDHSAAGRPGKARSRLCTCGRLERDWYLVWRRLAAGRSARRLFPEHPIATDLADRPEAAIAAPYARVLIVVQ